MIALWLSVAFVCGALVALALIVGAVRVAAEVFWPWL